MKSTANESNLVKVKVWDLFVRIFHWLLAALIVVMLVSANFGNFDLHITTGKTIVILVIARLFWGIVGSSNARITALVFKPSAYINYIKTLPQRKPGYSLAHSPIGSLAVIAILGFLIFQLTTGLFAADVDGLVEGPFAYYISYELSRTASNLHLQNVDWLISIIVLHIAANLFYFFYKRDNLIKPMLTGSRSVPKDKSQNPPRLASPWRGLIVTAIVAAIMIWVYVQYG